MERRKDAHYWYLKIQKDFNKYCFELWKEINIHILYEATENLTDMLGLGMGCRFSLATSPKPANILAFVVSFLQEGIQEYTLMGAPSPWSQLQLSLITLFLWTQSHYLNRWLRIVRDTLVKRILWMALAAKVFQWILRRELTLISSSCDILFMHVCKNT